MIPFQGRSPIINVISNACILAGRKLLKDFGEVENLQVSKKGNAGFFFKTIQSLENTLKEELLKARPEWSFLIRGKKLNSIDNKTDSWIINPLDGEINFTHGIPHISISVAAESRGKLIAGCVYDPIRKELFFAENGSGAFMNDRRIRVSGRNQLQNSLLNTGINLDIENEYKAYMNEVSQCIINRSEVRVSGCSALDLAWVAAGRTDGFWQRNLNPSECSAGIILVKEAGGFCTDFSMRDKAGLGIQVCAANPNLHGNLIKFLHKVSN